MDPLDPLDAQQVVVEYARLLERDVTEARHPASMESLPYGKPVIKAAIRTSVLHLAGSGDLTDELRQYLETAYALLAEYLDSEVVRLMTEYRRMGEELTAASPMAREKTQTPAWRTIAESSALAGEVARSVTAEAETLRAEFRAVLTPV